MIAFQLTESKSNPAHFSRLSIVLILMVPALLNYLSATPQSYSSSYIALLITFSHYLASSPLLSPLPIIETKRIVWRSTII